VSSKRVALVLGSGGLKQLVALPVFDYLDREGHQIVGFVGTSGGALIAALRALGHPADIIEEKAKRLWRRSLFRPVRLRALFGLLDLPGGVWNRGAGLIDSTRIRAALLEAVGDIRMEDLPVPLFCMATDLLTGEAVILDKGRLVDALYASVAQPPFLPAGRIGDRLFVDAGYTDSIAVERAFAFEPDVIISLTTEERPRGKMEHLGDTYARLLCQVNSEFERWTLANALPKFQGELITLNTLFPRRIPFWETEAIPYILEAGEAAVETLQKRLAALEIV
jgi:NTE family protein